MRSSFVSLGLLVVASVCFQAACLEGDPNPYKPGAEAGAAANAAVVQPSGACAQGATGAVLVTFRNQLTDRSLDLFWVDHQCKEIRYATINPGSLVVEATFVGHPWRVRDSATGALYKEFVARSTTPVVVDVP